MTERLDTREAMRDAFLSLIATSGEATLDAQSLRAMFVGKKDAKKWAAAHKLTIERTEGGTVFKQVA